MSTEEVLPPNYRKLDGALRAIGYSFEVAVADIVDNSIDAGAKSITVRLLTRKDGHLDLAIWDDGHGMTDKVLREAMRFGSDVSEDIERLGKFGLGLKLASLSQAKEVRVVTAAGGRLSGRAWLEHGITKGFTCTVYERRECQQLIDEVFPDRQFMPSATMVWWSRLYRLGHHGGGENQAQKLSRRLQNHLSLAFHRFLAGRAGKRKGKVKISVDIRDLASGGAGIPIFLDPLDPFGYEASGHSAFPSELVVEGAYKDRVAIKAHIWPPNSTAPGYKLPGGTNARQGFYFYRNDRLIQGGGWNGIREVEPHASLARLEIDISPDVDVEVGLDVKKVEIQLPPDLVTTVQKASNARGVDLKKYLSLADQAYRTRKVTVAELPLIPSRGLPAELTRFLHKALRIKATAKHRDLKISWDDLDKSSFFEFDRDSGDLYLNRLYREQLLHGRRGSSADLPVLKCLLFLVLENALLSERLGPKIRERVALVNRILVEAVKHERAAT